MTRKVAANLPYPKRGRGLPGEGLCGRWHGLVVRNAARRRLGWRRGRREMRAAMQHRNHGRRRMGGCLAVAAAAVLTTHAFDKRGKGCQRHWLAQGSGRRRKGRSKPWAQAWQRY